MLLEEHPICYFDPMFDQSSFTQVQVTAGKQVFPFEWQLSGLLLLRFRPFPKALEVQGLQDPSLMGLLLDSSEVLVVKITGGIWLAGMT